MIKEIIHDPLFLSQKSQEAFKKDKEVIKDLEDTLKAHKDGCVGMAANMIGVRKNIIIFYIGMAPMVMVNAHIINKTKPYQTEESCLSLPGGPRKTVRYEEIEVEYLDRNFQKKKGTFTGFTAQIIQHELDHVQGILI